MRKTGYVFCQLGDSLGCDFGKNIRDAIDWLREKLLFIMFSVSSPLGPYASIGVYDYSY